MQLLLSCDWIVSFRRREDLDCSAISINEGGIDSQVTTMRRFTRAASTLPIERSVRARLVRCFWSTK
jgi:hypothetical protein